MNDALQFEHAENAGDQHLECGACQHSITHVYHEMNGRIFCDRCRRNFDITSNSGSRFSRAMLSIVAGTGAAVAGALLYLAIVSSYVPPAVNGLQERAHQAAATTTAAAPVPPGAERPSVARFAAAVAVVSVIVFVAPFLMGFKNAIGLALIIAVGLYQAWKMNRGLVVNFFGPDRTRPVSAVAVPQATAAARV